MCKFALICLFCTVLVAEVPDEAAVIPVRTDPEHSVLIFVPQHLFNDQEFDPLARLVARAGLNPVICSRDTGLATSMERVVVNPGVGLADASPANYAALVLVGGSGMATLWNDSLLHARIREFNGAGRVVAAIGIAPVTLARSGMMENRRATVFPDRYAIGYLKERRVRHSFRNVVVDGNVITASTSDYVRAFSRAVIDAVQRRAGS